MEHICHHCKENYTLEEQTIITTPDGETYKGHCTCMHVVYSVLKENKKL